MKNLITLFIFAFVSFSVHTQNVSTVSNNIVSTEINANDSDALKAFTLEIASQQDFKYRTFLKESKNSNQRFQVGKQLFTKTQLIKVLRKGAIRTENIGEFQNYLFNENGAIVKQFSKDQLHIIYHLFRKGSFEKYIDDLSCCL